MGNGNKTTAMQKQPLKVLYKIVVPKNFAKFTEKHRFFLAQVFSYEFWEIFENTSLTEHLWVTAFHKVVYCKICSTKVTS